MPTRLHLTGLVCHALNRSARQLPLFNEREDYQAFLDVLVEAQLRQNAPVPLLGFCVMPTHWHLVLWPQSGTDLSRLLHRLTMTHAKRWNRSRGKVGAGAVYQGRFKAIPVQTDRHLYTLLRYVERNPVRARLVDRAEEWPWSSATSDSRLCKPRLSDWPVPRPQDWLSHVNRPETEQELEAIRSRIERGVPLGELDWAERFARSMPMAAEPAARLTPGQLEVPV